MGSMWPESCTLRETWTNSSNDGLHLGLHDGHRAWKSFDWDALARLHKKGLISDPVRQARSVAFTDEGLAASERLLHELVAKARSPN